MATTLSMQLSKVTTSSIMASSSTPAMVNNSSSMAKVQMGRDKTGLQRGRSVEEREDHRVAKQTKRGQAQKLKERTRVSIPRVELEHKGKGRDSKGMDSTLATGIQVTVAATRHTDNTPVTPTTMLSSMVSSRGKPAGLLGQGLQGLDLLEQGLQGLLHRQALPHLGQLHHQALPRPVQTGHLELAEVLQEPSHQRQSGRDCDYSLCWSLAPRRLE
mmetsp:Transcript_4646/g.8827  ORF Transcript_4646/g.8827 Transcript_4646/m.8827 type:complete len:216 (+) Transcript_4646:585-1232(+)